MCNQRHIHYTNFKLLSWPSLKHIYAWKIAISTPAPLLFTPERRFRPTKNQEENKRFDKPVLKKRRHQEMHMVLQNYSASRYIMVFCMRDKNKKHGTQRSLLKHVCTKIAFYTREVFGSLILRATEIKKTNLVTQNYTASRYIMVFCMGENNKNMDHNGHF